MVVDTGCRMGGVARITPPVAAVGTDSLRWDGNERTVLGGGIDDLLPRDLA